MSGRASNLLKDHVEKNHFDKLEEFNKLTKEDYIELAPSTAALAEKEKDKEIWKQQQEAERLKAEEDAARIKKEEEEKQIQQQRERERIKETLTGGTPSTTPKPVSKIEIPLGGMTEPTEWLTQFLQRWDISQQFLVLQEEKFKLFNALPSGVELERDLNDLDSGSKGKLRNAYIRQIYERALQGYMEQRNAAMQSFASGQRINVGAGWQITGNAQEPRQQDPMNIWPKPSPQPPSYSPYEQNELHQLKQEMERMRQEKYNEMTQKVNALEAKLEAQKQAIPAQDPVLMEIRQRLDNSERENKRLQESLTQQSTQNLMNKFAEMEQAQKAVPNTETMMRIAEQVIEQQRTKLTPEELERKIQEVVAKEKTGITPEAVDMAKIEKTFELDKLKIESDKSKISSYGEILNSVAGIFGESLGRGLATVGQPPLQQPKPQQTYQQPVEVASGEPDVKICPSCNKALYISFPPGITTGQCPYCNTAIEMSPSGELVLFSFGKEAEKIKTAIEPVVQPEPRKTLDVDLKKPAEPSEPPMGTCEGCGRDLYFYNIAETDVGGKQWCKTCIQNRGG